MIVRGKNLEKEFESITDHWSPKVIGEVNDQYIKIAKLHGEFVWHAHDDEDEMFLIIKGQLDIEFEDKTVHLEEGDFHIVPKGIRHNPKAESECWVLLVETKTTKHTGEIETERTKSIQQQLLN